MLLKDKIVHLNDRTFVLMSSVAAALLSTLLILLLGYERGIGTDGAFYALSGYHWFHTGTFTYSDVPNTFTWPMLSLLVGCLSLVIDNLQICMHIVLTAAFALSVFPFFYALKNFFGHETAQVGGVLFVLNGFMIRLSVRMLPEMLVVLFVVMSVFMVSKIYSVTRDSARIPMGPIVLAGFFTGLAYLTKPEAGLYVISATAALTLILWKRKQRRYIAILPIIFGITILPQVIYIHTQTGKWELTTYNRFFFRGAIEPLVSMQPSKAAVDRHVESNYNAYIVRQPYSEAEGDRYRAYLPIQLRKFAISFLTIIGIVHLLIIGLGVFRKTFRLPMGIWLCFIIPMIGIFFWYNITDRFFLPFVPWFLAISVAILTSGTSVKTDWQKRLSWAAMMLVCIQSFTPIANQSPTNAVIGSHAKLGKWMRENLDITGKLIADRKPYVTFDVKGRYYRYNHASDTGSLVQELQQRDVDYLVVDDFYTRTKNPGVINLLDEHNHAGLEFVHEEIDERWGKAILYRVTTP